MIESVILTSPVLILGYGVALFLCIFDLITHSSGYVMPVFSIFLCVAMILFSLYLGASLMEICIVVLIFLLLNLLGICNNTGGER